MEGFLEETTGAKIDNKVFFVFCKGIFLLKNTVEGGDFTWDVSIYNW